MNRDTIVVGIPVSLTGQFSSQGAQTLYGVRCWVEDTNSRGGLCLADSDKPRAIRLIHYDDESKPSVAQSVTRKLITDDKVDLLLGPYSSSLTLAAASVAEEYGKVLWNQGGASDEIYRKGFKSVVGVLTSASRYLVGVVEFLMEGDPKSRALAIARSAMGSFPEAVISGMRPQAITGQWKIVCDKMYQPSSVDFRLLAGQIKKLKPDVIVGVGRIQDDLGLARELVASSLDVEAVVLVAAGIAKLGSDLGESAEGLIGPSQWEPGELYQPDYGPSINELSRRHKVFSSGGDYAMAQAYAGGLAAERCLLEAGSLEDTLLRESANTTEFTTFYGPFKLDPQTGSQAGRPVLLVQWQKGRKVVIWPPALRQGRAQRGR